MTNNSIGSHIYRLDDGSEVYTGNQKPEGRMSALHGPRVSDFPYTPRESIV